LPALPKKEKRDKGMKRIMEERVIGRCERNGLLLNFVGFPNAMHVLAKAEVSNDRYLHPLPLRLHVVVLYRDNHALVVSVALMSVFPVSGIQLPTAVVACRDRFIHWMSSYENR
jgi:hypothetical protein